MCGPLGLIPVLPYVGVGWSAKKIYTYLGLYDLTFEGPPKAAVLKVWCTSRHAGKWCTLSGGGGEVTGCALEWDTGSLLLRGQG